MSKNVDSKHMRMIGIVTLILGILVLTMPLLAGDVILEVVGILVAGAGALRMFWAFKATSLGKGIWTFLLGVLTLFAGLAVLAHPMFAGGVLTLILSCYLVGDGMVEFIKALTLPKGPGKAWLMFGGLASIVLAVMIFMQFPLSGTLAIGIFLGIKLIFVGMTMLTLGTTLKTATHT